MEEILLHQVKFSATYTFTYSGVLSAETMNVRLYNDTGADRNFDFIRASVGSPATGSSIYIDILKNGTSIFGPYSFLTLELPAGMSTTQLTPGVDYRDPDNPDDPIIWREGEYLTVSILQIGSDFPGEDLTINVVVSE